MAVWCLRERTFVYGYWLPSGGDQGLADGGIYHMSDIHQRTDRGDMRCLGQEGAYLAVAGGADAFRGAHGRLAPPASEQFTNAEVD